MDVKNVSRQQLICIQARYSALRARDVVSTICDAEAVVRSLTSM